MSRLSMLLAYLVAAFLLSAGMVSTRPTGAYAAQRPHRTEVALRVSGNHLVDASGRVIRLLGVDVTGTEDACVKAKRSSWGPLTEAEATTIERWGADAVRVPLNEDCWLGLNGLPRRFSSARYRAAIQRWVADLNRAGLIAILDLHWSAPGSAPASNQGIMPDATHSIKFWREVAKLFKSDPGVVFDLFNEPALGSKQPTSADWTCWRTGCDATVKDCPQNQGRQCTLESFRVAGMQQLLDAVRATGAHQPVMVGGLHWAGDPCGTHDLGGNGGQCMWLKYRPTDPDHQLVASYHTYSSSACNNSACWDDSVLPVAHNVPVITGEVGEKACSSTFVMSYMRWADRHTISYLIWSWQLSRGADTCAQQGTRLIDNWTGRTNRKSPVAPAVQAHLRAQLGRQGRRW